MEKGLKCKQLCGGGGDNRGLPIYQEQEARKDSSFLARAGKRTCRNPECLSEGEGGKKGAGPEYS